MSTFRNSVVFVGTLALATSLFFESGAIANSLPMSFQPSGGMPSQQLPKKGGTVQITGLTYDATTDSYTATDDDGNALTVDRTDSEAVSTISQVVYTMGGKEYTVDVDEDTQEAVLTIAGVQYDLLESYRNGTVYRYSNPDDVKITLTTKGAAESGNACIKFYTGDDQPFSITYYTRAAAWIDDTGLLDDYSATPALVGGYTNDSVSNGVKITSKGGFFSGYYIDGAAYSISNLDMSLEGYGGDDFQGWGAGVVGTNGADITIDNSFIETEGVIRTALWFGGQDSTTATVTNTVVAAYNDDDATPYTEGDYYAVPMMEIVPFALGLVGNIRATNVLGNAEAIYTDSIVVSNSWGALSTDSGTSDTHALDVSDVLSGIGEIEVAQPGKKYTAEKRVNGVNYGFTMAELGERSGYVSYADSGIYDTFDNVQFYAPDYVGIIASNGSLMYLKDSYGYTERMGFMVHKNTGATNSGFAEYVEDEGLDFSTSGGLYIDGGEYHVKDAFVVVKSVDGNVASPNIEVDGATIDIYGTSDYSGTLLRLMESDDAGSPGVTEYTIDDLTTDEYEALTQEADENSDTTATFSDMTVTGDIYNTVYSVYQELDVTLDDMKLTGTISSAMQAHVDADGSTDDVDGSTVTTDGDGYLYIGRVSCTAYETINNPVALTLENGTTWTVTGTSYVAELTVDDDSTIKGTVTVDGEEIVPEAGETYTDVVVYPADDEEEMPPQDGNHGGMPPQNGGNHIGMNIPNGGYRM